MANLFIEGKKPLSGSIKISGSTEATLLVIAAAMFSNEDIIIENAPKTEYLEQELELLRSVGGGAAWLGNNRLLVNGGGINSYDISKATAGPYKLEPLLVAPLLFRFGKVKISHLGYIQEFQDIWQDLGFTVTLEETSVLITKVGQGVAENLHITACNYLRSAVAVLAALTTSSYTVISNICEDTNMDMLLNFLLTIRGDIDLLDTKRVHIAASNVFTGGTYRILSDDRETIFMAIACIITNGNVVLQSINKTFLTSFVNLLMKVGAKYEFGTNELRIWHSGHELQGQTIKVTPMSGINPQWLSLITLFCTQLDGISTIEVADRSNLESFKFIQDLNRMGAKVEVIDSLDTEGLIIKIIGTSELKGLKLQVQNPDTDLVFILAALCASGRSELLGAEILDYFNENIYEKLHSLGARLS